MVDSRVHDLYGAKMGAISPSEIWRISRVITMNLSGEAQKSLNYNYRRQRGGKSGLNRYSEPIIAVSAVA